MRHIRLGPSSLLALLCAGPCAVQSADTGRDPILVYAATCHFCHDSGIGVPLKGSHFPADRIRATVRHGHGPMVAFTPTDITDAELSALAQMLSEAAASPAAARPASP